MAKGDRVIAVSRFIAELVASRYPDAVPRIRVIPGGVDAAKFDPAAVLGDRAGRLAQSWRLKLGAPTIMLPGRLTGWKGQKLLISAVAALRNKDALAVLVGGDQGRAHYVQELITHAQRLGVADRVRLAGDVEDMPAAMMLADVVVNASTDPEAFGRTIIEAQAMARMVIATDHGGARETIIDGENRLSGRARRRRGFGRRHRQRAGYSAGYQDRLGPACQGGGVRTILRRRHAECRAGGLCRVADAFRYSIKSGLPP